MARSPSRLIALIVPSALYAGIFAIAYIANPANWAALQTCGVALTGLVVIWYTWETRELRMASYRQIESQIRPYVVLQPEHGDFLITNHGNGVALHVRIDPVVISPELDMEIRFPQPIAVLRRGESAKLKPLGYQQGEPAGDMFNAHVDPQHAIKDLIVTIHFDDVELKSYSITQRVSPGKVIVSDSR